MTDTEATAAATKTKKSATAKPEIVASPAELFTATAKQVETTWQDGIKTVHERIQTLVTDTADLKIATEEAAKLMEHGRGAAADGLAAMSREITDFIEKSTANATTTLKSLLAAKSPLEALEIENRYILDAGGIYLSHLQRLHGIGIDAITKAMEPLADSATLFAWWKKAA